MQNAHLRIQLAGSSPMTNSQELGRFQGVRRPSGGGPLLARKPQLLRCEMAPDDKLGAVFGYARRAWQAAHLEKLTFEIAQATTNLSKLPSADSHESW